jgi:hypothetical protein
MSASADRCSDKATMPQTGGSLGAVEEQVSGILPYPREERVVQRRNAAVAVQQHTSPRLP